MRAILVLMTSTALLVAALTAAAQSTPTPIAYGESVQGAISNESFEKAYSFEGAQGDVVIIEMKAVEVFGDLSQPEVLLLDATNNLLGASDTYGDVTFAAKLPADGSYTILATREDGRSGDSVGEFILSLSKPDVLSLDTPTNGTIDSESTAFYVYESANSFTLSYERSGDFSPEVAINIIGQDGDLESIGSLTGNQVRSGVLGIESASNSITSTYVITLEEALFDFNFDLVSADYTLTITE